MVDQQAIQEQVLQDGTHDQENGQDPPVINQGVTTIKIKAMMKTFGLVKLPTKPLLAG